MRKAGHIYYRGQWLPKSHFYDYGEEPIYMGPRRARKSSPVGDLFVLVLAAPVFVYVIYKIFIE